MQTEMANATPISTLDPIPAHLDHSQAYRRLTEAICGSGLPDAEVQEILNVCRYQAQ